MATAPSPSSSTMSVDSRLPTRHQPNKKGGEKSSSPAPSITHVSSPNLIETLEQNRSQPQPGPPQPPGGHDGANNNPLYQPRSIRFWLIILCNFLALFLVALDRTIIAVAVPRITDEFHSLNDIGWYGSSYMLTTACAQLLFGRIYKFYDMKWTFLLSVIVFEIGSTICGAAPSSTTFILGRAIAGLGSAGIFGGCLLIMIPMVPLHRRPAFQGLFGVVFGVASALGPLIGGGFTGAVSWRWCFYINLPIGAVTLVFMVFFWNPPRSVGKKEGGDKKLSVYGHVRRLDPLGMFFFLPGTVCLFVAFQWGGSTYRWDEWRVVLMLVVFGVCFIAFVAIQILMPETASVPPRIITQRSVAFGNAFTFFLAGSMLMLVYYVPIWFQTVKQVAPFTSGINTLPLVMSLVLSSLISGALTQKIGYYVPSMLASPTFMAIGNGLLSSLNVDSPTSHWVSFQFVSGFGLGFGMQTSGLAIQTVLPREDISIGIATNFFVQQLGGAVFTAVGQTILTNVLVSRLGPLFPDPGDGRPPGFIVHEGATQLTELVAPADKPLVVEAYNAACHIIFLVAMGLAFASLACALGMEWKTIKKGEFKPPASPEGGQLSPPPQQPTPPSSAPGTAVKETGQPPAPNTLASNLTPDSNPPSSSSTTPSSQEPTTTTVPPRLNVELVDDDDPNNSNNNHNNNHNNNNNNNNNRWSWALPRSRNSKPNRRSGRGGRTWGWDGPSQGPDTQFATGEEEQQGKELKRFSRRSLTGDVLIAAGVGLAPPPLAEVRGEERHRLGPYYYHPASLDPYHHYHHHHHPANMPYPYLYPSRPGPSYPAAPTVPYPPPFLYHHQQQQHLLTPPQPAPSPRPSRNNLSSSPPSSSPFSSSSSPANSNPSLSNTSTGCACTCHCGGSTGQNPFLSKEDEEQEVRYTPYRPRDRKRNRNGLILTTINNDNDNANTRSTTPPSPRLSAALQDWVRYTAAPTLSKLYETVVVSEKGKREEEEGRFI